MTVFLETYVSILNPCYYCNVHTYTIIKKLKRRHLGNMHTYATTKELKEKTSRINSQNEKVEIVKYFYQNTTIFSATYASILKLY